MNVYRIPPSFVPIEIICYLIIGIFLIKAFVDFIKRQKLSGERFPPAQTFELFTWLFFLLSHVADNFTAYYLEGFCFVSTSDLIPGALIRPYECLISDFFEASAMTLSLYFTGIRLDFVALMLPPRARRFPIFIKRFTFVNIFIYVFFKFFDHTPWRFMIGRTICTQDLAVMFLYGTGTIIEGAVSCILLTSITKLKRKMDSINSAASTTPVMERGSKEGENHAANKEQPLAYNQARAVIIIQLVGSIATVSMPSIYNTYSSIATRLYVVFNYYLMAKIIEIFRFRPGTESNGVASVKKSQFPPSQIESQAPLH